MKAVAKIVEDMGLNLTAEQVKDLDQKVRENYVTRAEHEEKLTRIQALTEQVNDLNSSLESSKDADEKVRILEEQVKAFQDAEAEREAKEAEEQSLKAFADKFDAAVGERRFANQVTRDSVLKEAFGIASKNPQMEVSDILKQVVGDANDIWANPQSKPGNQPSPTGRDSSADTANYVSRLFRRE